MRKRNKKTLTAALALILMAQPLAPLAGISRPAVVHAASTDDSGVSDWSTWGSVKWGVDSNGTLWIEPSSGDTGTTGDIYGAISGDKITKNTVPWYVKADSITSVRMKGTIKATSCSYMFAGLTNCTDIDLTHLDGSGSDGMQAMFANDEKLTTITGLDKLDTSKTTSMFGVFENCKSLPDDELAQIADWDVSKVTNFDYMFNHVDSATTIPVSKWDTSSATTMFAMFENNNKLTSLDVSGFKMGKVEDASYMFTNDSALTTLDVSKWDTSSATTMLGIFSNCTNLATLNVSGFKMGKVKDASYMFNNCSDLANLDVSSWNTSSLVKTEHMFDNCTSLKTLDISKWNTAKLSDTICMFNQCHSLTELDPSNWDTSNFGNIASMFSGCRSLTKLDLSKWNTVKVYNMYATFMDCQSLTDLDISTWNTSNLGNLTLTFLRCYKLKKLDLSKWDVSNVTVMNQTFNGCNSLSELDISTWKTPKVGDFFATFSGLSSLDTLDISSLSTTSAKTVQYMFANSSIKKLVIGKDFTSSADNTNLWGPLPTSPYTGRWSKEDGTDGMSAKELMTLTGKEHDKTGKETGSTLTADARAGTWVWEKGYKLTIDANGGSGTSQTAIAALASTDTYGTTSASVVIPDPGYTKLAYKENGASENKDGTGAKYQFGDTISLTSDKTIYTNWLFDGYSVKYDANGGSGTMSDTQVAKGDKVTVSTNSFINDGYAFDCWNTDKDGKGTSYKNGDSFTPSGDTTLYAQWKGVDYSVAFSANGGSGSMSDEAMTYGQEKALSANKFTRDMYDFTGWNTRPDGKGTSYKDGESVKNLTKSSGGTVKLYAQWKKSKWISQGQDVSKTDDNTEHDTGSYILTIPTKIQLSGGIGKVDVSQDYKVNVTGNLNQDSYVHVNASAGDMSTGSLKLSVEQGKKLWTEADAWGSLQADGSRSGIESNDKITLTGTAESADAFTGTVTYTSSESSSKYDDSTYGDFKITSANKPMVETYEGSGIGGYTAGTTLSDSESNVSSRVWSIDGTDVSYGNTYTVTDSDLARGKSGNTFKSNKLTETITYNDGTKKTAYVYLAVPLTYETSTAVTLKRTLTDNGNTATEGDSYAGMGSWRLPVGTVSFKAVDTFVPSSLYLFAYPAKATLTLVDGTNIDTSNVTNMQDAFYQCSKITTIDVSGWNTSKVTNTILAFGYMSSLTSLPGIENWDMSNVTGCQAMFYQSPKLHADLSKWNLDKVDEESRNGSFANDDPYVIQPNWRHK